MSTSPNNKEQSNSKESFIQKVIKSPSTQNLLNHIHHTNGNNNNNNNNHPPNHSPPQPPINKKNNSFSDNESSLNTSIDNNSSNNNNSNDGGESNSLPPNYTPPVPPKNNRVSTQSHTSNTLSDNESVISHDSTNPMNTINSELNHQQGNGNNVIRSESSISIISNSSSGSGSNNNDNHLQNLQRHSSNISMNTTDDSTEMDSMSPTHTMSSEFMENDSIINGGSGANDLSASSSSTSTTSSNNTPNNKKLTRKIAQFISSPKLITSITSLPNTPTHTPQEMGNAVQSCENSPGFVSPRGNGTTSPTNLTPTTEKEKKKKKFLKKPEIFKSHHKSPVTEQQQSSSSNDSNSNGGSLSPSSTSTNLISQNDKKSHKKSHKKTKSTFDINTEISTPYNVIHKMHVDFDLKWTGHNDFKLDEKLGDGAYGSVYKGTHKDLGFTLAIKVIEMKESESQSLQNEINILKNCKSPNVVSYYGSLQHEDNVWILMDFCALGSIRDIIESTEKTLNESQISFVVKNTLKGLIYLHSQNIIHRDVKAANILLGENCEVKIADFGVSEKLSGAKNQSKEMIGTPLWMAPEVILKKNYDFKADVWSLGITIIEMADGLPPHMDMNPMRAMKMVPIWPPPTFQEPKKWSPLLNDFLARCLNKDPEKRSSPIDLLCHPFLRKEKGPEVLGDLVNQLFRIKKKKHDELKKQQKHQQNGGGGDTTATQKHSNENGGGGVVDSNLLDNTTETNGLNNDSYIPTDNSVKLATANIGTFNFKGNYTTCRDFGDDDEDDQNNQNNDEEDEDIDPFGTTIFHGAKGSTSHHTDDEEDGEEEGEEDEEDEEDAGDEDDEEISATGTMVMKKKKKPSAVSKQSSNLSITSSGGNNKNKLHTPPLKPLPTLPPTLLSSSNGGSFIQSEFKTLEDKLVSYIDQSNKSLIQDIKNDVKALESSIISQISKELVQINLNFQQQLQQSLSPILSTLDELKKQQSSNSSFQPSKPNNTIDKKSAPTLSRQTSFKNSSGSPTTSSNNLIKTSSSPTTTTTTTPLSSSPSSSNISVPPPPPQNQQPQVSILRKSSSYIVKQVVDDNSIPLSTSPNNSSATGRSSPLVMKRFTTSLNNPLSNSGDSFLSNSNIEKKQIVVEEINKDNPVKDKVKMFETSSNDNPNTPPSPTITSSNGNTTPTQSNNSNLANNGNNSNNSNNTTKDVANKK